jgi:hypothetical protein
MRRAAVVALALVLVGCTGGEDGESSDDARAAIEGFDASPEAGFGPNERLGIALIAHPEETHEAALDLLASGDPDVRIAAIYALSVGVRPEDAEALAPILKASDPGEQVLAAAGLLAVGDARGIPVLIQALGEDAILPFGAPPAHVWEQARYALLQSTGQDLGLGAATTAEEAAATVPAWESWWSEVEGSFEVVPAPEAAAP